jgi:preprotein translocase subunit SecA
MFHYLWERNVVRSYNLIKDEILNLEKSFRVISEEQLKKEIDSISEKLKNEKSNQIKSATLIYTYAVIREIIFRKIGLLLFPTQIFGGIVLHYGNIAQMNTGEGKTLTAILPVCLNALAGKIVFVVTVNEYLANRDWEIAKPVFEFIGINSGVNMSRYEKSERKHLYENCSVVYSTGSQLGFDYLSNNLVTKCSDKILMKYEYVLIDEVDSILIDEAQNPLIISSLKITSDKDKKIEGAMKIAKSLIKDKDYEVDEKEKNLWLTEFGVNKLQKIYEVENFFNFSNQENVFLINNCLKALIFYRRGIEYIVDNKSEKIVIIDGSTGRLAPKRIYSSGIHQSIEVKEGLNPSQRGKASATITYQNFFRLFGKISGMTGTAKSEANEFREVYGMEVIKVEPNKKLIRKDNNDLIFLNKRDRNDAVIKLVKKNLQTTKRPILIGSPSLEESEYLSGLFKILKIKHSKLNAINHYQEAKVIADAGNIGSLTIATNMAGRGTDIILKPESIEKGGLLLIGLGRNLNRRLDNQLIGRVGRQGNPGETKFYLSLEDDLLKNYNIEKNIKKLKNKFHELFSKPISSWIFDLLVSEPQEKIKELHSLSREQTLNYDLLINKQRKLIYEYRESILDSDSVFKTLSEEAVHDKLTNYFSSYVKSNNKQVNDLFSFCNDEAKKVILKEVDLFWSNYLQILEKIRNMLVVKMYLPQDLQEAFFFESNKVFNEKFSILQFEVKKKLIRISESFLILIN